MKRQDKQIMTIKLIVGGGASRDVVTYGAVAVDASILAVISLR